MNNLNQVFRYKALRFYFDDKNNELKVFVGKKEDNTPICIISKDREETYCFKDGVLSYHVTFIHRWLLSSNLEIDGAPFFKNKVIPMYQITGLDKANKRFIITTSEPQHYNIWQGTLWKLCDGVRKIIKRYYN